MKEDRSLNYKLHKGGPRRYASPLNSVDNSAGHYTSLVSGVLIGVLTMVIVVGSYMFNKQSTTFLEDSYRVSVNAEPFNLMKNWEIYSNDRYSFKYPPIWKVDEDITNNPNLSKFALLKDEKGYILASFSIVATSVEQDNFYCETNKEMLPTCDEITVDNKPALVFLGYGYYQANIYLSEKEFLQVYYSNLGSGNFKSLADFKKLLKTVVVNDA